MAVDVPEMVTNFMKYQVDLVLNIWLELQGFHGPLVCCLGFPNESSQREAV
jgi:hypothetical protein